MSGIKGRLYTGFAFAFFLVISVGVVSLTTLQRQNNQVRSIKQAYQVINQLEVIQRILIDMETGRRGFRATHDVKFLQPYNEGLSMLTPAYTKLVGLIEGNPLQERNAGALKIKIDSLLQFWTSLGMSAPGSNLSRLIQIGTAEKEKMDLIRAEIASMKSIENVFLAGREQANNRSVKWAKWELVVGIVFILFTVVALVCQILKELKNRLTAEENLQKNLNELDQLNKENTERNEILKNQQEELRQSNEELTSHAEVMHLSEKELRIQEEELRNMNVELEEKNEAIETARLALAMKAKELEETNKYKSEFLANMSHELRTPLNSVLILARLLADNTNNNLTEKQVAHAKIIHKSGSDLLRLINNILDLSKIEAGKVEVYYEPVSIQNIANDIEQLFAIVAEEKEITYTITIEPGVPKTISTDKQKVDQVLKNLLSNAFKFTLRNGAVSLTFKHAKENGVDYLSMVVEDTGIGIHSAQQQMIFEAFQQADGATTRKYGGTGLGLSITKELVRLLKGIIRIDSKENEGSVFTVLIPFDNKAIPPASMRDKRFDGKLRLPEEVEEQTIIPDDRHTITRNDKVMLIIEDDQDFATIIKGFAGKKGYKTVIALKGDEGLLCARKYHPSAIILDMGLPVIDGRTLLQAFRKDRVLKHIPVHIISASEDLKFSNVGALAFLKKPIDKSNIDKAFMLIEEYLHSSVKRVLVISTSDLKKEIISLLVEEKNYDIKCDVVPSVTEALEQLASMRYDCIVADVRTDVEEQIVQLNFMYEQLLPQRVPTIIYLDEDISEANELKLRKMAHVIVRRSSASSARLMDELELFLYKVEGDNNKPQLSYVSNSTPDSNLQKKKVLLVDDDMRNVFAITAGLEEQQMEIFAASDGKEAIDILERNKEIDIVLMDIMMPNMDGYEAMRTIRNKMQLTKLPIIALTAKAMVGDKEKCIQAGASDYITKPVEVQKLVSLMRVWLA